MRENGTGQRQITNLGGFLTFPDYSPDGRRIAMSGIAPGEPEETDDIWVSKVDRSGLRRLTHTPAAADQFPAYSPVGTRIVFVSNRGGGPPQLWLIDADGGAPRQLTSDPLPKGLVPERSPDGARIAYTADDDIWVIDSDGTDQVQLTHTAEPEGGAAWSPSGRRIAFLRTGALGRLLHTMAAVGSDVRIVRTEGPVFTPTWQSPGRHRR